MRCFRLEVVREDRHLQEDGEYDEASTTFLISRDVWQGILRSGNIAGTLTSLNSRLEIKCGVCGSFLVPAGPFLEFVQETEASEKGDDFFSEVVRENLWHIYRSLVETKFNDEDAFWQYWQNGGGDHRLLRDKNGELVFDEFTGWPLGLAYDDVAVKITTAVCSCCDRLFRRG